MALAKKTVLTGGPCSGKTSIAQLLGRMLPINLIVLPESASLLFIGGFPRWPEERAQESLQRAIYRVQIELETSYEAHYPKHSFLLDRGTVDGAAYWPGGSQSYFESLKTTLATEFSRYYRVLYLESVEQETYERVRCQNPNRVENWEQARALETRNRDLWQKHPNFVFIPNHSNFQEKVQKVTQKVIGNN